MDHEFTVTPKLNCRVPGPIKGWESVEHADVYIYEVACQWRFLWYRARTDIRRTIKVRIVFKNGVVYESYREYWTGEDSVNTLDAIYRALKEFSRRGHILTA